MEYKKFQEYQQRALSTVYEEGQDSFHNDLIPVLAEKYLAQLQIGTDAKILDIGCGSGQFLHTARRLGYSNTTGVSPAPCKFRDKFQVRHDDVCLAYSMRCHHPKSNCGEVR